MLAKLKALDKRRVLIGVVLAAAAVMIVVTVRGTPAKAADKGAPKAAAPVVVEVVEPTWTGFGAGVRGGVGEGAASLGGADLAVTGQMAGGFVFYRHQFGPLVLGVDAGYDRVWGDLHAFGIDYTMNAGASVGVLPSKNALLYTRVEWLRAVGGGDHLDGWGLGGGAELKIPGTPVSFGIEYMHDWMDKDAFGPGIDVRADRMMALFKVQLGGAAVPANLFADR